MADFVNNYKEKEENNKELFRNNRQQEQEQEHESNYQRTDINTETDSKPRGFQDPILLQAQYLGTLYKAFYETGTTDASSKTGKFEGVHNIVVQQPLEDLGLVRKADAGAGAYRLTSKGIMTVELVLREKKAKDIDRDDVYAQIAEELTNLKRQEMLREPSST